MPELGFPAVPPRPQSIRPSARWARPAGLAVLIVLPFALQAAGDHWVRVADTCLLYVMLALGMNVVVGFAGLLDLGYVAFYALGAYLGGWLASPHLAEHMAAVSTLFPGGLHAPWWFILPLAGVLAALLGMLLGAPTLRLRGDYLAIVTLGFGEIVRILINNLGGEPLNLTNGAQGLGPIDSIHVLGLDLGRAIGSAGPSGPSGPTGAFGLGGWRVAPGTLHYFLFLALVLLAAAACQRLQDSRLGRAWMALRDDELAAEAMGLDTRRLKLLAFGIGASFGGVAGALFGSFQVFISPEAFSLQESVMIVAMVVFGGLGHVPGVIAGAVLLAALPEALRYVAGPLQAMTDGRIDAGVLRPLLVSLAMVGTMLWRPRGLWPQP